MDCSLKAIIFMDIEVIRAILVVTDGLDFACMTADSGH